MGHTHFKQVPCMRSVLNVGSRGTAAWNANQSVQFFIGLIAEMVMVQGVLDNSSAQSLELYLKNRYNL